MEFRLLGPLDVFDNGRRIAIEAPRQRALLALLLLRRGEPASPEQLANELWGEEAPARAVKTVQVYVAQLRKALGPGVLVTHGRDYGLSLDGHLLDVEQFELLAAEGRRQLEEGQAAAAAQRLREALALWSGPPLADFSYDEFAQGVIARLEDERLAALEVRIEAELTLGRHEQLVPELRELVRDSPLRERLHAQLIVALYRCGRQAEALAAYQTTRRLLDGQLGIEPGRELQELEQAVLRQDRSLDAPSRSAAVLSRARRRGGVLVLTGGALILIAAAASLMLVLVRGGRGAAVEVGPNSVAAIDPIRNAVVAAVPVGSKPGAIATGPGALWVANPDANSISRIDTATNQVRQTVEVGGGPSAVAAGGGGIWVANGLDGTLSRIDPTTSRVVQTIVVGNGPSGIAYGAGAVWVANSADGTVARIDPKTGRVTKTLPGALGVSGISFGFDRVWVVSPAQASVISLDPRTGVIDRRIGVGVDPGAIAAGAGAIWVTNRGDGTASRIDPRAGVVTDTIRVGNAPNAVAVDTGGVWVSNGNDGTLSLIDPLRRSVVKTVDLGNPPQGLAMDKHGIYVAVRASGAAHRGGTLTALDALEPPSLDPAAASLPTARSLFSVVYDGLVGFRRDGGIAGIQLVPDLAVSLPTPTDEGKTYTFRLRPGIRYSNGKLVEPQDFRAALERLFETGTQGGTLYNSGIVGAGRCRLGGPHCDLSRGIVTNSSARTVTIHLTAPDAELLDKLAMPPASFVPPGTPVHGPVDSRPVPGTGPYMIASYRKGHYVRLSRNPYFREWSADAQPNGYPDHILWRFDRRIEAETKLVQRGTADYTSDLPNLPKPQLELIATRFPSQLHANTAPSTSHFFLNTRVAPFGDVRVRRAVNIAFDRNAFARRLGKVVAAPTCQLLPPASPGFRRFCPYAAGSGKRLEVARNLVRSSGTTGTEVAVWVPSAIVAQGRYMAAVLESLGYHTRVRTVPMTAYFNNVLDSRVRAQVGYYTWAADYPSAATFLREQFTCNAFVAASPGLNTNLAEFCDPHVDAAIARATAVQAHDPPAAALLWQSVERQILAQAPVVPTSNRRWVDFVAKRVGNYQFSPQLGFLIDQAWVK
jgi:peptide/nickel transport system substrate-binding protein